ncbi:MBL fold metallo-hydrolase [Salinarimonas ramus]|uniref:Phosphoribosyl 1,2-cyclic phosphodiesterase n=1 Tax=Salinarimonas ramus TaxID=690164 RepID=A0A917QFP1_9HYPH|nr:MBL fold metallo-hydrolase [Salinarimonas ramus]GGK48212.1 phosphoribosyl 1,2-cyclic phosphodiesterase [Salinarimonas ramus]
MSAPSPRLVATILGCGSSGGVPRPGSGWGKCDPAEPRNRRRRCALHVARIGTDGETSVLVDTGPDLRLQLIDNEIRHLDGVLYTHDHADHTHGIDDLRPIVIHMRKRIPVWADAATSASLIERFGYCFRTPEGSDYPPILEERRICDPEPILVEGAGGVVEARPFRLRHGSQDALGFRFGDFAYAPDVSVMPSAAEAMLAGLDTLVIDALRDTPHPSHYSVSDALALIERVRPRRAVLTNLHTDLDYDALKARLPAGVEPAYDGMRIEI